MAWVWGSMGWGVNNQAASRELVTPQCPAMRSRSLEKAMRHLTVVEDDTFQSFQPTEGGDAHPNVPPCTYLAAKFRRCTDVPCLILFLAFLSGMMHVYTVARTQGNLAKLTHGFDWKGDICGVDAAVRYEPILLWCNPKSDQNSLALLDGICVSRCPSSETTEHWCPGAASPFQYTSPVVGDKAVKKVVVGMVRNLTLQRDYVSTEALGYCFPDGDVELLNKIVSHTHISTGIKQLFAAGHGALDSWRFLVGVAAACVLLGYLFLLVLHTCFDKLLYVVVAAVHGLLIFSMVGFAYAGFDHRYNIFSDYFAGNTPMLCAFTCSFIAFIVWVLLSILCYYCRAAVQTAIDSIKATCEVIGQLPTVLLQPLLHSVIVIVLLLMLVYGFAWLLSMGKVVTSDEPVATGGIEVSGLRRSLEFSDWQWLCIGYWVFGLVWILETLNALGQFAISHAVAVFGYSNDQQLCPMLCGYGVGLSYHLGTLAFGGFIMACFKLLATVLAFLSRQTRDDTSLQGAVSAVICSCCACCTLFIERILKMVNDLVYADVALQGTSYLKAAENVVCVAASNPVTYILIKGSATAVRVIGVTVIGGVGTLLSYQVLCTTDLQLKLGSMFQGATSVLKTSSILGTTCAAAIVCFYVAIAFMMVFYQTTYALMYCMLSGDIKRDAW